MTHPNPDRPDPTPDDEAFVRKVAGLYRPEDMSSARRSAFDARLEERLAQQSRWSWKPVLAGVVAVLAAALLLLRAAEGPRTAGNPERLTAQRAEAPAARAETTAEDAILALTTASAASVDQDLPEEYVAIDTLFLGG